MATVVEATSASQRIRDYLKDHPAAGAAEIEQALGVKRQLVYQVRSTVGGPRSPAKSRQNGEANQAAPPTRSVVTSGGDGQLRLENEVLRVENARLQRLVAALKELI